MNTRDNPALWDIQLSTWVFCEFNVSGYVLVYSASSWFQGITRCTQRWFSPSFDTQTFITLLWPTAIPAGFRCNKHRTCTLLLWQAIFTDRQTAIFTITTHFPHEERGLDTYTQHDKLWRWTPHTTSGVRLQHDPVLSALYANFRGFLKLLASRTDLRLYSSSASCKHQHGYRFACDPTIKISSYDSVTNNSGVSWS